MTHPDLDALIQALLQARRTGPLADDTAAAHIIDNAEQAYAVQAGVARALGFFDAAAPMHWKSGGPDRGAVLTHAPLPPAGVWQSPCQAGSWPFRLRGIEAEVALRLGQPVDAALAAALDAESAARLIDAQAVSIEIVDSRWQRQLDAPALLKLADLQSHGALVLGPWTPYAARDWAAQVCRVQITAQDELVVTGTHPLGDPAWLLPAWLRHATRDGAVVPAGAVVTTGSWIGIVHAQPGDAVTVEFEGLGHATLQF